MVQDATLEDLNSKEPEEGYADFITDRGLAIRWQEATQKLQILKLGNDRKSVQSAEDEVAMLRPEVEAATRRVRFKSIGRKAYSDLIGKHRPTPEQRKRNRDDGMGDPLYNPDTFPPALIAAAAIAPEMTLEQAKKFWDSPNYNEAELETVFTAAIQVNGRSTVIALGKEFERTAG